MNFRPVFPHFLRIRPGLQNRLPPDSLRTGPHRKRSRVLRLSFRFLRSETRLPSRVFPVSSYLGAVSAGGDSGSEGSASALSRLSSAGTSGTSGTSLSLSEPSRSSSVLSFTISCTSSGSVLVSERLTPEKDRGKYDKGQNNQVCFHTTLL